ncbi:Uncharacterised protein [Mycobacteroides abscessus subsp. abscessus]|nr:Uncharacterised protein [Mycobacteroides abscessus subsp. abscessus]
MVNEMVFPTFTSVAASRIFSWVIRLTVPSWSCEPHLPQLEHRWM